MERPVGDRGSVFMLLPAAVLIVLMLAAVAVDLSLVFLRQREATSYAVDLANDLATIGLDDGALRSSGQFRLVDEGDLTALAWEMASDRIGDDLVSVQAHRMGAATLEVVVVLRADYVFASALPGDADGTDVTGSATAEAAPG